MKKIFQTSPIDITEVIYNKKTKKVTFKKWWAQDNSKTIFVNWAIYETYSNDLKNFEHCNLKQIEIACTKTIKAYSKYPNPIKHISKFNIY